MRLDPTERLNLTLSAGAVAACFAVATPNFASSVALGAALEAINFRALCASSRALFGGVVAGGGPWVGVLGLRFALVAAGIAAGLTAGAHPIGLVLGLSLVMPSVVIAALWNRPPLQDLPPEPALAPDDPSWETYSIWRAREIEPGDEDEQ